MNEVSNDLDVYYVVRIGCERITIDRMYKCFHQRVFASFVFLLLGISRFLTSARSSILQKAAHIYIYIIRKKCNTTIQPSTETIDFKQAKIIRGFLTVIVCAIDLLAPINSEK